MKEEEQQKTPKRDQSPELARISPLITRPPKMKPPPTTEGTAQIHSSVTPPSTSSSSKLFIVVHLCMIRILLQLSINLIISFLS